MFVDGHLAISAIWVGSRMAPRVMSAIDAHRFKNDVKGIPAEQLPGAIHKATNTRIGSFLSAAYQMYGDSGAKIRAIFAEADDPALAHAREALTLGDSAQRASALGIIETKLSVIATFEARPARS